MWMVEPKKMCRKHLLGEHVELHMLVGTINKGRSIAGFINKGLAEPYKIKQRHEQLAKEMAYRGYKHKSELPDFEYKGKEGKVDIEDSEKELITRCGDCRIHAGKCPVCLGKLKFYDGMLGYESLVCEKCGLDINDWRAI